MPSSPKSRFTSWGSTAERAARSYCARVARRLIGADAAALAEPLPSCALALAADADAEDLARCFEVPGTLAVALAVAPVLFVVAPGTLALALVAGGEAPEAFADPVPWKAFAAPSNRRSRASSRSTSSVNRSSKAAAARAGAAEMSQYTSRVQRWFG